MAAASASEQLSRIAESLELERIAGWIEKEHRRLLADLPPEADMRIDPEAHAGRLQAIRKRMPIGPFQHDPEMRNRHIMTIDGVGRARSASRGVKMGDDL